MQIQIPNQENKLSQPNNGDFDGNIWATWNMDFISNPGAIRVSPQTSVVMSNLDSTYMVYPVQFVEGAFLDGTIRIWAICDGVVFYTSSTNVPSGGWTKDATANTPTALDYRYSDGVEWNGSLIVSGLTALSKLTAGTWTASYKTGFTTAIPHPLGKGFNNLLLVGDYSATYGAVVTSIDTSDNVYSNRLIFGKDFQVVWIRSSSNMIYVGCKNINGGRAKVFAWDGSAENYNYDYKINGSESFAGVIQNEVPYTINERGELLALTGSAFTQIAKLPIFNTDNHLHTEARGFIPSVTRNGMTVQDNRIHILLKAAYETAIGNTPTIAMENMLSGIWCYDPQIGLHHRYSVTHDTGANIMDYGSPTIVAGGALMTTDKLHGNMLIGCSLYINAATTLQHEILTIKNLETDTSAKLGYFITPKISTQSVQENWQKAWLVIKQFLSANSKVKVKWRIVDRQILFGSNDYSTCTWSDADTFTTAESWVNASAGDEVEIMTGEGSGLSATISGIIGTNVVDIAESVSGASGTLFARVGNWTDCGTDINIQGQEFFKIPLAQNSTYIQFKVIIFAEGKEEVKKLIIKSDSQLPVV